MNSACSWSTTIPGVSEVIGLLLEREGYAVESAATLKEALTRVDSREPMWWSPTSSCPTAPGST